MRDFIWKSGKEVNMRENVRFFPNFHFLKLGYSKKRSSVLNGSRDDDIN